MWGSSNSRKFQEPGASGDRVIHGKNYFLGSKHVEIIGKLSRGHQKHITSQSHKINISKVRKWSK